MHTKDTQLINEEMFATNWSLLIYRLANWISCMMNRARPKIYRDYTHFKKTREKKNQGDRNTYPDRWKDSKSDIKSLVKGKKKDRKSLNFLKLNKAKRAARANRIGPFLVYTGLQIAQNLIDFFQISRILRRRERIPRTFTFIFPAERSENRMSVKNTQKKKKKKS